MSTPICLTVSYPRKADGTFDHEHYHKTHMAIAQRVWNPQKWEVLTFDEGPHIVQALIWFESAEAFGKAMTNSAGREELGADVKNYTNLKPVTAHGPVVASS